MTDGDDSGEHGNVGNPREKARRSDAPSRRSNGPPSAGSSDRHALAKARLRQATIFRIADGFFGIIRTLIRAVAWCAVAYCLYLSVAAIAGKSTAFQATVNAVFDLSIDRWLAYALAGGATVGYYRERKLRQRTIRDQATYIRQLESKIDPHRSSSGLSPTGRPSKEDLDAP